MSPPRTVRLWQRLAERGVRRALQLPRCAAPGCRHPWSVAVRPRPVGQRVRSGCCRCRHRQRRSRGASRSGPPSARGAPRVAPSGLRCEPSEAVVGAGSAGVATKQSRTSEDQGGFTVRLALAQARCGAPQVSPPRERCGEPRAGGPRSRSRRGRCRHRPLCGCRCIPSGAAVGTCHDQGRVLGVADASSGDRLRRDDRPMSPMSPKASTGGRCASFDLVMLATPSQCRHWLRACASSAAAAVTDNPCRRAGRLRA